MKAISAMRQRRRDTYVRDEALVDCVAHSIDVPWILDGEELH